MQELEAAAMAAVRREVERATQIRTEALQALHDLAVALEQAGKVAIAAQVTHAQLLLQRYWLDQAKRR